MVSGGMITTVSPSGRSSTPRSRAARPSGAGLLDHLPGVPTGGVGDGLPTEHARHLFGESTAHAVRAVDDDEGACRDAGRLAYDGTTWFR